MADVVNLNQFRKKHRCHEKEKRAAESRVRFGRTKSEKETAQKTETDRIRKLDGKKRETPPHC